MNLSGRVFLMVLLLAFLGLMVGIDGLLQGEWLRSLAGWAWFGAWVYLLVRGVPDFLFPQRWRDKVTDDLATAMTPTGSWPLIAVCAILSLAFAAGAVGALVVPWDDAALWNEGVGDFMHGLQGALGEWGARLVTAGLFGFCAFAAGKTTYVRYLDTGAPRKTKGRRVRPAS